MTEQAAKPRRNMLRRLYDWILHHAKGPHAWELMGAISFAESSFLPIAPDFVLIPMVLADRKRAFELALWCTVTSVIGGWLGYAIGALLYDSVGQWLIQLYGYGDKMEEFRKLYAEYGDWIIIIKGATPIPYKIVTIASGFAGYDFWKFTLLSFLTRGFRFGLVAALLYWRGEAVKNLIEKHLGLTMFIIVALLVIGLVMARYAF